MKTLKRSSIVMLAAAALIFSGCQKIKDSIEDSIKLKIEETETIVIPSGTIVNLPIDIITPEQESSLEEELELNDSRKDKVKTIMLKELKFTITDPPGKGFRFLNAIRLYIRAGNLPEKEIGYLENIPDNAGSVLSLNVYPEDDLAEYLKQDKFSMKASIRTDEILTSQTTVEIYSRFEVTADLF